MEVGQLIFKINIYGLMATSTSLFSLALAAIGIFFKVISLFLVSQI